MYGIEEIDFIDEAKLQGDIENLHIEIVKRMLYEQMLQDNEIDIEVFIDSADADLTDGGFDWDETDAGYEFWDEVLCKGNHHLFYLKYPHVTSTVIEESLDLIDFRYTVVVLGFRLVKNKLVSR